MNVDLIRKLYFDCKNAVDALSVEYKTPEFAEALWKVIANELPSGSRTRHSAKAVSLCDRNTKDVSAEYNIVSRLMKVTQGENHVAIFYDGFPFYATSKPFNIARFMSYAKRIAVNPSIMPEGTWEKCVKESESESETKEVKTRTGKKKSKIGVNKR